jgi:hypothetical protein
MNVFSLLPSPKAVCKHSPRTLDRVPFIFFLGKSCDRLLTVTACAVGSMDFKLQQSVAGPTIVGIREHASGTPATQGDEEVPSDRVKKLSC